MAEQGISFWNFSCWNFIWEKSFCFSEKLWSKKCRDEIYCFVQKCIDLLVLQWMHVLCAWKYSNQICMDFLRLFVFSQSSNMAANWTVSQIPHCTCPISHNTPVRKEICTFLFWVVYCWIWGRTHIVGFDENGLLVLYIVILCKFRLISISDNLSYRNILCLNHLRLSINSLRPRPNRCHFTMTFSNIFSWMKMSEFCWKFHWSLKIGSDHGRSGLSKLKWSYHFAIAKFIRIGYPPTLIARP